MALPYGCKLLGLALLVLMSARSCMSAVTECRPDSVWVASSSPALWTSPANWRTGFLPVASSSVEIKPDTYSVVEVTDVVHFFNLTVKNTLVKLKKGTAVKTVAKTPCFDSRIPALESVDTRWGCSEQRGDYNVTLTGKGHPHATFVAQGAAQITKVMIGQHPCVDISVVSSTILRCTIRNSFSSPISSIIGPVNLTNGVNVHELFFNLQLTDPANVGGFPLTTQPDQWRVHSRDNPAGSYSSNLIDKFTVNTTEQFSSVFDAPYSSSNTPVGYYMLLEPEATMAVRDITGLLTRKLVNGTLLRSMYVSVYTIRSAFDHTTPSLCVVVDGGRVCANVTSEIADRPIPQAASSASSELELPSTNGEPIEYTLSLTTDFGPAPISVKLELRRQYPVNNTQIPQYPMLFSNIKVYENCPGDVEPNVKFNKNHASPPVVTNIETDAQCGANFSQTETYLIADPRYPPFQLRGVRAVLPQLAGVTCTPVSPSIGHRLMCRATVPRTITDGLSIFHSRFGQNMTEKDLSIRYQFTPDKVDIATSRHNLISFSPNAWQKSTINRLDGFADNPYLFSAGVNWLTATPTEMPSLADTTHRPIPYYILLANERGVNFTTAAPNLLSYTMYFSMRFVAHTQDLSSPQVCFKLQSRLKTPPPPQFPSDLLGADSGPRRMRTQAQPQPFDQEAGSSFFALNIGAVDALEGTQICTPHVTYNYNLEAAGVDRAYRKVSGSIKVSLPNTHVPETLEVVIQRVVTTSSPNTESQGWRPMLLGDVSLSMACVPFFGTTPLLGVPIAIPNGQLVAPNTACPSDTVRLAIVGDSPFGTTPSNEIIGVLFGGLHPCRNLEVSNTNIRGRAELLCTLRAPSTPTSSVIRMSSLFRVKDTPQFAVFAPTTNFITASTAFRAFDGSNQELDAQAVLKNIGSEDEGGFPLTSFELSQNATRVTTEFSPLFNPQFVYVSAHIMKSNEARADVQACLELLTSDRTISKQQCQAATPMIVQGEPAAQNTIYYPNVFFAFDMSIFAENSRPTLRLRLEQNPIVGVINTHPVRFMNVKVQDVGRCEGTSPPTHQATFQPSLGVESVTPSSMKICADRNNGQLPLSITGTALQQGYVDIPLLSVLSAEPTSAPTLAPTAAPTGTPTEAPTESPSPAPSPAPSVAPTQAVPTESPTVSPTLTPTETPTETPTVAPTVAPTANSTNSTNSTDAPTPAPTFGGAEKRGSFLKHPNSVPSHRNVLLAGLRRAMQALRSRVNGAELDDLRGKVSLEDHQRTVKAVQKWQLAMDNDFGSLSIAEKQSVALPWIPRISLWASNNAPEPGGETYTSARPWATCPIVGFSWNASSGMNGTLSCRITTPPSSFFKGFVTLDVSGQRVVLPQQLEYAPCGLTETALQSTPVPDNNFATVIVGASLFAGFLVALMALWSSATSSHSQTSAVHKPHRIFVLVAYVQFCSFLLQTGGGSDYPSEMRRFASNFRWTNFQILPPWADCHIPDSEFVQRNATGINPQGFGTPGGSASRHLLSLDGKVRSSDCDLPPEEVMGAALFWWIFLGAIAVLTVKLLTSVLGYCWYRLKIIRDNIDVTHRKNFPLFIWVVSFRVVLVGLHGMVLAASYQIFYEISSKPVVTFISFIVLGAFAGALPFFTWLVVHRLGFHKSHVDEDTQTRTEFAFGALLGDFRDVLRIGAFLLLCKEVFHAFVVGALAVFPRTQCLLLMIAAALYAGWLFMFKPFGTGSENFLYTFIAFSEALQAGLVLGWWMTKNDSYLTVNLGWSCLVCVVFVLVQLRELNPTKRLAASLTSQFEADDNEVYDKRFTVDEERAGQLAQASSTPGFGSQMRLPTFMTQTRSAQQQGALSRKFAPGFTTADSLATAGEPGDDDNDAGGLGQSTTMRYLTNRGSVSVMADVPSLSDVRELYIATDEEDGPTTATGATAATTTTGTKKKSRRRRKPAKPTKVSKAGSNEFDVNIDDSDDDDDDNLLVLNRKSAKDAAGGKPKRQTTMSKRPRRGKSRGAKGVPKSSSRPGGSKRKTKSKSPKKKKSSRGKKGQVPPTSSAMTIAGNQGSVPNTSSAMTLDSSQQNLAADLTASGSMASALSPDKQK